MKITKTIAKKVLAVVDAGLSSGLGNNAPGEMCVEAAVCFALGLPHSDNPPCVGDVVRAFKIRLNDSCWSSKQARTTGMRKIAVAQLGSDKIDQKEFSRRLTIKTCNRLLPKLFRLLADHRTGEQKETFLKHAALCARVTTIEEAKIVAAAAAAAARALDADAARAAAIYDAAAAAIYDAARAAARAADAAAAIYDAANAAAAIYDAANAAARAAAIYDARDEFLSFSVDLSMEVLIELKSSGTKFLDLCKI